MIRERVVVPALIIERCPGHLIIWKSELLRNKSGVFTVARLAAAQRGADNGVLLPLVRRNEEPPPPPLSPSRETG